MGRFEQVRANLRRAYAEGWASVRAARAETRGAGDDDGTPNGSVPAVLAYPSVRERDDAEVPHGLRIAAAWAWRVLLLIGAVVAVLWTLARLQLVVVPLVIALLLSALLSPAVAWLRQHNVQRSLATFIVLIGGLALVAGTLTLVINEFIAGAPELSSKTADGVRQVQDFLQNGPLHLSDKQLQEVSDGIQNWLNNNRSTLTSGAVNTATTLWHVLAGLFLVLFSTFFLLRDGRRISRFLVGLLPHGARDPIAGAGDAAWRTLVAYVRASVLVAFIDALGIGLALAILRVEFAFALAALVFLAAFIPIVGATLSGAVAVLIALVDRGWVVALIVLASVIAVQQLEGHVLQPLIMGRAVAIHPLAVIVAIAAGAVLAGIVGALVAVPIVAVLNTAIRHLAQERRAERGGPPPDDRPTGPPMPAGPDAEDAVEA